MRQKGFLQIVAPGYEDLTEINQVANDIAA